MTVDTAALRRTHVEGWRPKMSVEIVVSVLEQLLEHAGRARTGGG